MRAVEAGPTHGNYIGGRWEPSSGGRTYGTIADGAGGPGRYTPAL